MGGPGLQKFFLGLRASVWSKTKGGRAPGPLPWIRHCYWPRHSIHKNKQTPSPKICIAFVFHFSCVLQSSQEKLKTLERFRVKFTANGKRQTRDSSSKCLKDEQVKTDKIILINRTGMRLLSFCCRSERAWSERTRQLSNRQKITL